MKITRRKIQGATYMPPNPYDKGPADPKESDTEAVQDKFQITFDALIEIDADGDWSPVDEEFSFLESPDSEDGSWYSYEYPTAAVADIDDIISAFDKLVTPLIDDESPIAGKYQISGTAYLVFDSDISYKYEHSEDEGDDWKSYVDVEDVDSTFNERNSEIVNFEMLADVSSATRPKSKGDEYITYDTIYAADGVDEDVAEEGEELDEENEDSSFFKHKQKYTSKNTATNWKSGKTPALFKKIDFKPGDVVLDYGGGTEESAALAQAFFDERFPDVEYVYYDKYWQSGKDQNAALRQIKNSGGADVVMLSNVLNTIAEPEVRQDVLAHVKSLLKPNGTLYIYGHQGTPEDQAGGGRTTGEDQYQTFMKTKEYLDEVHELFPDAVYRGGKGLIIAPNTATVTL